MGNKQGKKNNTETQAGKINEAPGERGAKAPTVAEEAPPAEPAPPPPPPQEQEQGAASPPPVQSEHTGDTEAPSPPPQDEFVYDPDAAYPDDSGVFDIATEPYYCDSGGYGTAPTVSRAPDVDELLRKRQSGRSRFPHDHRPVEEDEASSSEDEDEAEDEENKDDDDNIEKEKEGSSKSHDEAVCAVAVELATEEVEDDEDDEEGEGGGRSPAGLLISNTSPRRSLLPPRSTRASPTRSCNSPSCSSRPSAWRGRFASRAGGVRETAQRERRHPRKRTAWALRL